MAVDTGVQEFELVDEFADDMYWLTCCIDVDGLLFNFIFEKSWFHESELANWYDEEKIGRKIHSHFNSFLIRDEKNLLFDAGPVPANDSFLDLVEVTLDGEALDYFVVSHPDVDHTGNFNGVIEKYPDVTVVGPRYGANHEAYYLDDAMKVAEGDEIELGDRTVAFHDAPFIDSAATVWMTERTSRTIFPVDFIQILHTDDECSVYGEDLPMESLLERVAHLSSFSYSWIAWSEVDKLKREIRHVIEEYEPSIIAPSHSPIIRENTTEFLRTWETELLERIRDGVGLEQIL
jgi:flavorubredoxin